MYERLATKSGDVLWLRTTDLVVIKRHQVALWCEAAYWRRKRREAYKQGIEL